MYLDSDKIGAAPGVMFRRSDALHSWDEQRGWADNVEDRSTAARPCPELNVLSVPVVREADHDSRRGYINGMDLSPLLGAETWGATLSELCSDETTGPYRYEWGRDNWAIVLSGRPTLRHADGKNVLATGDTAYFPQGLSGAHQFVNCHAETARLVIFTSPRALPTSAFYPDDATVLVRVPGYERSCSMRRTRSTITGTENQAPRSPNHTSGAVFSYAPWPRRGPASQCVCRSTRD